MGRVAFGLVGGESGLELALFGTVDVRVDGSRLGLTGHVARSVVAVLWAAGPAGLTAEQLADEVWSGDPPSSAGASLRNVITRLRRAAGPELVVRRHGRYALGDQVVDPADRIGKALERIAGVAPADAVRLLDAALAGSDGVPFGDLGLPSLIVERERLETLVARARLALAGALMESGREARAVGEAERVVAARPFDEGAIGLLMKTLYRAGRQADALHAYAEAQRRLGEELGLEPSPLLRSVETAILLHDPSLRVASRPAPTLPVAIRGRRPQRLVGRTDVVERLMEAGRSLDARHQGHVVLIEGDAGIGKTAVLSTVAAGLADEGLRVHFGSSLVDTAGGIDPLLDELLGDLGEDRGPAGEYALTVIRTLEAAATQTPLVIAIDDVHAADAAAARLVGRVAGAACPNVVVVATARPPTADESGEWPPLRASLLAMAHVEVVSLAPLDADDIEVLIGDALGGSTVHDPFRVREAVEASAGRPFIARVLASELMRSPTHDRLDPGSSADIAARVLAGVDESTRCVLATAGTMGVASDVGRIAEAARVASADVMRAAEVARGRGIADIDHDGRVRFRHHLWQEVMAQSGSSSEQKRRHEAAAGVCSTSTAADARARARHLRAAVPVVASEAAATASADAAALLLDHGLAADAAEEARAGLDVCPDHAPAPAIRLRTLLAGALAGTGRRAEAKAECQVAATMARDATRWDDLTEIAMVAARATASVQADPFALETLEQALLVEHRPRQRAGLLAARASLPLLGGSSSRELDMIGEAELLAKDLDDAGTRAAVLRARMSMSAGAPLTTSGVEVLVDELCVLSEDDPAELADALSRRVWVHLARGEIDRAEDVLAILAASLGLGAPPHSVWLHGVLRAEIAQIRGDFELARSLAEAALDHGLRAEIADATGSFAATSWMTSLLRGEAGALVEATTRFADLYEAPAWHAAAAISLAWDGRVDDAGVRLDTVVRRLDTDGVDIFTPLTIALAAEAALTLGAVRHALVLAVRAEPYAGEWPQLGAGGSTPGPIDRVRAGLLALAGRTEEAEAVFADAVSQAERAGAAPWLTWTLADRAVLVEGAAAGEAGDALARPLRLARRGR